ncbi:hypothetical protein DCC81_03820 [Chitinophaga parva]|uniref:Uncharacterized protein n=1 Tax=Chitinophaga parva TaxID=2169414 RepID=A0A2T7BLX6_9BACT|nr:hypothetical protein [Chitinophaga parva]PUZ28621.1 hypothetical protein DCC81_03820 [Chitinophaga parva]
MRKLVFSFWRQAFMALGCTAASLLTYSQGQTSGQTADSIQISNVQATGDPLTGQVKVTMDFTNHYSRPVRVHLVLGGFDGLGLTDNKGGKYKIHTTDQLAGTADINKGFNNITSVQFGDKRYKWLTFVEQQLTPGASRQLSIGIPKVSPSVTEFNEINTRRQVSINYAMVADHVVKLPAVPIQWKRLSK